MVAFLKKHEAPYERSDFAEFFATVEAPTSTTYKGYTVYKQGFGSQGPSLLQTLNILENFDLRAMGHNSPDYIHTLIEAMKLSYADRDTYYADPAFVQTPAEGLLSKAYAKERAAQIDPKHASTLVHRRQSAAVRFAGEGVAVLGRHAGADTVTSLTPMPLLLADAGIPKDTTHIAVIDKDGNMFDTTSSGGWISGAVILGDTGIAMSVRGEQFWLDETHADQLRPRSRPRYTLTPSLVLKDGKPFMALGTPGGDNQEQTILQAFLDIVEFWDDWYPNLHTAFAWPRVQTMHFYGSVWPHRAGFNRMNIEEPILEGRVRRAESARARDRAVASVRRQRLRDGRPHRPGQRQPDGGRRRRGATATRWRTDRSRQAPEGPEGRSARAPAAVRRPEIARARSLEWLHGPHNIDGGAGLGVRDACRSAS